MIFLFIHSLLLFFDWYLCNSNAQAEDDR